MAFISDIHHNKKLKELGINIKTKYIVGNKVLERNTDNSINDDITNGVILEKSYYKNKLLLHMEKFFDPRIKYTFIAKNLTNKKHTCSNCGFTGEIDKFIEGCPYCGTNYNIDYIDKDLGNKYYYDLVLRSNTYRIVTFIIALVVSLVLSFCFILLTSRTFNNFDIMKIFIYGIILSLVLYYLFYIADAYIILTPIKNYKENINRQHNEFWLKTKIDKKKFFNNLNYELNRLFYNNKFIVDYDILDYLDFEMLTKKGDTYVRVVVDIRIITINHNKLKSKITKRTFFMKKNSDSTLELSSGYNFIKCKNCGASIDVIEGKCSHCNTEIKYIQSWFLCNDEI